MQSLAVLDIEEVPVYLDAKGRISFYGRHQATDAYFHCHLSAESCESWSFDDIYMGEQRLAGEVLRIAADALEALYEGAIHDHIRKCLDGSEANNAIAAYKFERSL